MEKQMDLTESSGGQPPEKKRRGYGLLLRLIALVLVVALFVGMTSVDFSLVRYQGTDQMAAAQYLMDQTTYLQENRFERLKSLLTQLDSYSINLQAAERAIGRSDYDRAASFLEKAIPLCQDDQEQAELYIRLGCVYMLAEQPEPAMTAFDSGIQGKPEEAMPYLLRGQLRYQQGDLTGAAEDAGQYFSLGGAEEELLSVAASLCELGGDLEGALEALNRSKRQTYGYKAQLFTLDLSYLGWSLAAGLPSLVYSVAVYQQVFQEIAAMYGLVFQPAAWVSLVDFLPLWGWTLFLGLWQLAVAVFYLPAYQCVELGYFETAKATSGVGAGSVQGGYRDGPDDLGGY